MPPPYPLFLDLHQVLTTFNVRRSSTVCLDWACEHAGGPGRMGVDALALHGGRGPRPRAPDLRRARPLAPVAQGVRAPGHARRRRWPAHERPRRDVGLRRVVRHHPRRRPAGARPRRTSPPPHRPAGEDDRADAGRARRSASARSSCWRNRPRRSRRSRPPSNVSCATCSASSSPPTPSSCSRPSPPDPTHANMRQQTRHIRGSRRRFVGEAVRTAASCGLRARRARRPTGRSPRPGSPTRSCAPARRPVSRA